MSRSPLVLLLVSLVASAKTSAPVDIESNLSGDVTTDDARQVTLTVKPRQACREMTVGVRSVDGVVVESAAPERVEPCAPAQPYEKTVSVRVPPGVSGALVVDVSITLANGKRYNATRGFRLSRPGGSPNRASSRVSGSQTTDSNGKPVHVMPSQ